jgi:sigma-B regulation protein RsbU (phosphoserine phosphatase)
MPLDEKPLILIVDDNPQNLQVLGNILRENGYKVAAAQNGALALDFVRTRQPACILLDIMMPEIDGIETCRKLKAQETTCDIPVLFITGLTETQHKIEAFETGGVDYITKPFQAQEVLARVKTHIALRTMYKRLQTQNTELLRQQHELDQDLKAAAYIQQSLLPQTPPDVPNMRFAWQFMPCSTIGGDIFHIDQIDDAHIAMYLLDVSGHGVPSAMVTVPVSQSLSPKPNSFIKRAITEPPYYEIVPPAEVLNALAQEYPFKRFGRYFTIVYLILNIYTGHVRYSKAGHPEPMLVRRSGQIELLTASGPLIGMDVCHSFQEEIVTLYAGDRLFLYTDGITECLDQYRNMYGEERLQQELLTTRTEPLDRACQQVIAAVRAYSGSTPLQDDITLLACAYLGNYE